MADIDPNQLATTAQRTFYEDFSGAFNGASSNTFWTASTNSGTWDTLSDPTDVSSSLSATGGQMGQFAGEQQWFINQSSHPTNGVDSPFDTSGGGLTINSSPLDGNQQSALGTTAGYASGAINTYHSYAQGYGYFEIDATLTHDTGAWPGFWLEPDSIRAIPNSGNKELDVMEQYIKANDPSSLNTFYSTIHDEYAPDGISGGQEYVPGYTNDSQPTEHRYGMDFESDNITFWLGNKNSDGSWSYTVVGHSFATPSVFLGLQMYMIADLAIGGQAGNVTGADPSIHINSIEAYQAIGVNQGYVYTGDLNYTAGPGIGYIFLQGDGSQGPQTVHGNDTGDVIGSVSFVGSIPGDPSSGGIQPLDPNAGQGGDSAHHPIHAAYDNTIIGGAGNDTIYLSLGDTATGKAGDDKFVLDDVTYNWNDGSNKPATIMDFGDGNDTIDTHFMNANYTQNNGAGLTLTQVSDTQWDLLSTADNKLQLVIDLATGASGVEWDPSANHNSIIITSPVDMGGGGGGSSVSTSASSYTAPAGVTDITLTGSSPQTVTGNDAGDTFHSNNNGNTLIGGAGADVFDLGRGGDNAAGGGGSDIFKYAEVPWAAGHITDFAIGDSIDLTGLLATTGYSGSDPIGAGVLKMVDDGAGDTLIQAAYTSASTTFYTVAVVDHVSASSLHLLNGVVSEGTAVSTSAPSYTAPAGVTSITLTGSTSQSIDASATHGVTIISNNNINTLIGGSGGDMFEIGRGGDTVTGNGGPDTFSYAEVPWGGSVITDFNAGEGDRIEISQMLSTTGYTGNDPIGAGYLKIGDDGAGNAVITATYNANSTNSADWYMVATLDHVSSSGLHYSGGMIT